MKKGVLALLLLVGFQLQADESTIFEDHDLGIVMEIPHDLAKNWEISHTPTGAKLDIYHSGKKNEEYYVLVLGKLPLKGFGCERIECFYPLILAQIQSAIGEDDLFDDDDLVFEIVHLDHNVDLDVALDVALRSYRLRVTDVEKEMTMPIDIHIFYSDDHALLLLTAAYPWMDEEQLTGFSESLIETVHLIED